MSASKYPALLAPTPLPFSAPDFGAIRDEDFLPAIQEGIALAREQIARIEKNPEPPTFKNTIAALETASDALDWASQIFGNLHHADTSPKRDEIAREAMPTLTRFSSEVFQNPGLFARVQALYGQREKLGLKPHEKKLLEDTYRSFVRSGALLNAAQKKELRDISERLSILGVHFGENVLKAVNSFEMHLTDPADLAGLSETFKQGAAAEAESRGKTGWVITLHQPQFIPFMERSERRVLRQKLWFARSSLCMGGNFDNKENAKEILRLRHKAANILGYKNHAELVLERRMAATVETVDAFLKQLQEVSRPAAERDLATVKRFAADKCGFKDEMMPWDVAFYSEKLKESTLSFSEEALRPYFPLQQAIDGIFLHAEKLFDLKFSERGDLPLYHKDVRVFEVKDLNSGEAIGLFYADFFPRASKKPGAWATTFRSGGEMFGQKRLPIVSIVCNFTKPTSDAPSLLGLDEVRTLFHEFGHALHMLLSCGEFRSQSVDGVYTDFVELPSQLLENWVHEPEGLGLFARHYKTGEAVPSDWIQKILELRKFNAGMHSLRQTALGTLDFRIHTEDPALITDVEAYEAEVTKFATFLPRQPGTGWAPSFSHIFSGGYAAGYYSYKWSEMLEADAFMAFKEHGVFDKTTANSYRKHILEAGAQEHPATLYARFRGKQPTPEAMFEKLGLL